MSDTPRLPGLWLDWCEVTGHDRHQAGQDDLDRFAAQAGASRQAVNRVRTTLAIGEPERPVPWDLTRVLAALRTEVRHLDLPWTTRLRSTRLGYLAVLRAPRSTGGLGLTREQTGALVTKDMAGLRARLTTTSDLRTCPSCWVWHWLHLLGTATTWSRPSVRTLAAQVPPARHVHDLPDPEPGWRSAATLLPRLDRWGWVEEHTGMHPSSISALTPTLLGLHHQPFPPDDLEHDLPEPAVTAPVTAVDPEREKAILARADELNARIGAWLSSLET